MDNESTEKFKTLKAAIHVAMVLVFERECSKIFAWSTLVGPVASTVIHHVGSLQKKFEETLIPVLPTAFKCLE